MVQPRTSNRLFGVTLLSLSLTAGVANAHLAAFHKGMYCLNGPESAQDLNSYAMVTPLYQLSFNQWWFHHVNNCDQYPPADGDFLDLPAGGQFTVEVASNRAKTTLSYNGRDTSEWPDGATYPEDYHDPNCITSPNLHAQNQSMAAGTAFAISYQSDITKVTPDNLVVFTVRHNTPWKRVLVYDVPAALPSCPPSGCICSWGWVPNGCGQPNIYHQAFRCRVTGATSTTPVAQPKAPEWCEGNSGACVKGAKQMIYWNQAEGNNVVVDGYDSKGEFKSPGYNERMGFFDGAQNDIFAAGTSSSSGSTGNSNSNGGSSNSSQQNGSSGSSSSSSGSSSANNNSGSGDTNTNNNSGSGDTNTNTNTGSGVDVSVGVSVGVSAGTSEVLSNSTSTTVTNNNAPTCKRRVRRRRSVGAVTVEEAKREVDVKREEHDVNAAGVIAHKRRGVFTGRSSRVW